jgi:peptide deformylase
MKLRPRHPIAGRESVNRSQPVAILSPVDVKLQDPQRAPARPGCARGRARRIVVDLDHHGAPEFCMTVQPIRLFGDPVLRTPADPVTTFDKELRVLVKDLTETMLEAPGAGLAAPQIGVGLRVFVYDVDDELGHLINPTLDLSDEQQDGEEGCLSFPGLSYDTKRAWRAVAKGFNMHGEPVTIEGTDLLARCVQHETDHLDGVLFIDRLDAATRKEAMRAIREAEWAGDAAPIVKVSPHATMGRDL